MTAGANEKRINTSLGRWDSILVTMPMLIRYCVHVSLIAALSEFQLA